MEDILGQLNEQCLSDGLKKLPLISCNKLNWYC